MSFEQKLINVMKTQNLNQKDLVLRTGISKTTISGWLRGAANPAPERQRQVAQALGLPIDYFDDNRNQLIPKMTVEEVAYIMGISPPTIRSGLKNQVFPWGYAIETENGAWVYWINRNKFFKIEGSDIDD